MCSKNKKQGANSKSQFAHLSQGSCQQTSQKHENAALGELSTHLPDTRCAPQNDLIRKFCCFRFSFLFFILFAIAVFVLNPFRHNANLMSCTQLHLYYLANLCVQQKIVK